ncbi:COP1-interactive protein 1-like [Anguilla anguilla]|uniref:Uncharacterized protein n=1 Tax=Anguilla anguilla TaxID=7936 RepID=A0A9D3RKG1_ANGAN|nr:COP1-interactive protein 1-like [Anguilla anguilla]KAG5831087.1 hypothetical protein ANANG_G00300140 [Anguilla anguilla]
MLSDRYNNKNYNVTWDGSIGLLDHGDLTVVGKAGQCKMTSTGVPRHQARHAVCDRKVESRPSLATKVPKSKKYVYDKSNQVQNAEYWREMEIQRKVHSQPKAVQEDTEMPALQMHYGLCANYECTIRELKLQHNQTLANLKTEMESERILLEEKIGKLKQNMADGIQEKSRNRQKQLQEVQKENATLRGEIAALESQLKRQKAPEVCTNCQSLEMAVEEKALQLIEREKTVEELQRFCRKFCKQLTQQDRLLALMSELHIPK